MKKIYSVLPLGKYFEISTVIWESQSRSMESELFGKPESGIVVGVLSFLVQNCCPNQKTILSESHSGNRGYDL